MKVLKPKSILRNLVWAGLFIVLLVAPHVRAGFVYETPNEFLSSGDFNGDGIVDTLLLDKLTGNARVGYSDGHGNLTWSAPLVTGVQNATGCGVERFLQANRDSLAVTAPANGVVNLVDLSQTNSTGALQTFVPAGIGPHAVAGLHSPVASLSPGPPFLLVASSFNAASTESLDFGQWSSNLYASFSESGPFDLPNGLDISSNVPTLAVGLVRGATNDTLHLWNFNDPAGVVGAFSNLPPGSDYVFGFFNGEAMPRFIFYQPGGSNLTIAPLLQTNSNYTFAPPLTVAFTDVVENVYTLINGTNGSAVIQFGDGIQGLTVPNGKAILTSDYQTGIGAAGNVFTGIVPLPGGQFALFDGPPGADSAHVQVLQYNGTNFTKLTSASLPSISTRTTRGNVWLFQLEPFVNRSPGFIESLIAPDWTDGVTGLPGGVQVTTETDAGTNLGLGTISTNNLGAAPSAAAYGMGNQYNPAISVFSYSPPEAAPPVSISISPPAGAYGSPQTIAFTAEPATSTVYYRAGAPDSWHTFVAAFTITNDTTIQYYGITPLGVRGGLQFASYTFGNPPETGTNSPIPVIPGDTNTVVMLSTNQLTISPDGTVFYGRRSADDQGTIWAINLDGSSDTYITTGVRPRVSPDGRWMAFLRDGNPFGNQGNIWIRDLASGVERLLFNNTDYVVCYDWETNDAALLTDYYCDLWELSTNRALSTVLAGDCYDDAPVRNPEDGRIAFHNLNPSPTANLAGIYVANPDGSSPQQIISSVPGASWPNWSPDGQWLSFVDGNNTTVDAGINLWLARADGSNLTQLSGFNDGTNRFPHGAIWSPDGTALVGAGTIFGTNGLWIIPLTPDYLGCDGPPILLPTSPGDAIDFAGSIITSSATSASVAAGYGPGLYIRQTPGAVIVYWSTNYAGYKLESESNLMAVAWESIAGPYYLVGGYYEYWQIRSALSPQQYFRLNYTGTVVLSQIPQLTIQLAGTNALLSWPAEVPGFTIQSGTNFFLATIWTDQPGPYPTNGLNFQYTEKLNPSGTKYYRLRGP